MYPSFLCNGVCIFQMIGANMSYTFYREMCLSIAIYCAKSFNWQIAIFLMYLIAINRSPFSSCQQIANLKSSQFIHSFRYTRDARNDATVEIPYSVNTESDLIPWVPYSVGSGTWWNSASSVFRWKSKVTEFREFRIPWDFKSHGIPWIPYSVKIRNSRNSVIPYSVVTEYGIRN